MIRNLLDFLATLYVIVLIFRWLVKTFIPQYQNTGWFLKVKDITEPLLVAIRKIIPPYKGIDFSYLIAVLGVLILTKLLIALM